MSYFQIPQIPALPLPGIPPPSPGDSTEHIEHLKYKHELSRTLTLQLVLGLSVAIMLVPLGVASTLFVPLVNGGAGTIFWGWLVVAVLSIPVTCSLGEMAGKFPTNGGVYHWSFLLGDSSLLASWFVGWALMFGNLTMAVLVVFSGSQFFLLVFGVVDNTYRPHLWLTLVVYLSIVGICALVNLKGYHKLDAINRVLVHWTICTVLIIDALLLITSSEFNDLLAMLTTFEVPRLGWPRPIAFLVGLQQACFTFQGYGMLPLMTDEVRSPEKTLPWGMLLLVFVAAITGVVFLLPILACTPQLDVLLDKEANVLPIELIFKASLRLLVVSLLFVLLLCGTIFFGSVGMYTVASRSVYSLARDNGLPYSHLWTHVRADAHNSKIPNNAVYLTAAALIVFGAPALALPSTLYSFMGASVVLLAIANAVPIAFAVSSRGKLKGSAFRLNRYFGWICGIISVAWCLTTLGIFSLPVEANFSGLTMNYTSALVFIEGIVITAIWFGFGKNHFKGPEVDTESSLEEFVLNNVEESEGSDFEDSGTENGDTSSVRADLPYLLGNTPLLNQPETPNLLGDTPNIDDIDSSDTESTQDQTPNTPDYLENTPVL